jgi:hypothetical protein
MWAALFALAGPAHAFDVLRTDLGDPKSWFNFPIAYEINPAGAPEDLDAATQAEILRNVFAEWESVEEAGIETEYSGLSKIDRPEATDFINAVFWDDAWLCGGKDCDPHVLALTSTWSYTDAPDEIIGFDIRINAKTIDWGPEGMDFENAMAHEVGHALGFNHSEVAEATMAGTTHVGEIEKRDLHLDDQDGARFLYAGIERAASASIFGCNSAPSQSWAAAPLLLLALRRRRS